MAARYGPDMAETQIDQRLRDLGEQCPVGNTTVTVALAWWIAAELARRHLAELRILETHPGGGQYDCVSVYRSPLSSSSAIVHMNFQPGGHLTSGSTSGPDQRFNWLEVLLAGDRRINVVEQLEHAGDLMALNRPPSATERSIGPMVIGAFLQRSTLGPSQWTTANAVADDHSGATIRSSRLQHFDAIGDHLGVQPDSAGVERWYDVWFVGRSNGVCPFSMDKPEFALDLATGHLWHPDKPASFDLMDRFQSVGQSLDSLVSLVCPPAF